MEIELDSTKIALRLSGVLKKRQEALDSEVLKDSNKYVPERKSVLYKSGIAYTKLGSGLVQWRTSYARIQYYLGEKLSKINYTKNKLAQPKWCEYAKVRHLKRWEEIANGK